ncbi:tetratricopeptide repeat protein [Pontibacter pudoricolor]|uniref:tetratricopeptide repeat protein n=1 Tax=Pontibacter pudoricolor TaxID=2694930 RepID=UPI001391DB84|nr:tetratricopeptide repeat protein [Pontibacter pudoricolor]
MKQLIALVIFLALTSLCSAQTFQADFNRYCQENDTLKQRETLLKWEKATPKDPELFTGYFNYYFLKSREEVISLTATQPKGESLVLSDNTNKSAGYMASEVVFNNSTLKKGLEKIDEGIKLYPDRLDMRFGKIYALGQAGDWQSFTDEIVTAIQYSKANQNQWTWTNNEKRPDGKDFLLSSLQNYQLQLYNTGDDELLKNMRTIATEILKLYPDHIESLSNLSITYLLTGEYDKGIAPLLQAEKLNPKDAIVLANIAQGYRLKGDKKNAIEYYEKVIRFADDAEMISVAKRHIEKLK